MNQPKRRVVSPSDLVAEKVGEAIKETGRAYIEIFFLEQIGLDESKLKNLCRNHGWKIAHKTEKFFFIERI